MDNTHNLLLAFIEASGFEVKRKVDKKERVIPKQEFWASLDIFNPFSLHMANPPQGYRFKTEGGSFALTEGGDYIIELIEPVIDYKVTKKIPTINYNLPVDEWKEKCVGFIE